MISRRRYLGGLVAASALLKPRVSRYGEIAGQIAFFRELPEYGTDLFSNKRNKVTPEKSAEILPAVLAVLEPLTDWTPVREASEGDDGRWDNLGI